MYSFVTTNDTKSDHDSRWNFINSFVTVGVRVQCTVHTCKMLSTVDILADVRCTHVYIVYMSSTT